MKKILCLLLLLITFNSNAQLFKKIYDNVFKYSSLYAAGNAAAAAAAPV